MAKIFISLATASLSAEMSDKEKAAFSASLATIKPDYADFVAAVKTSLSSFGRTTGKAQPLRRAHNKSTKIMGSALFSVKTSKGLIDVKLNTFTGFSPAESWRDSKIDVHARSVEHGKDRNISGALLKAGKKLTPAAIASAVQDFVDSIPEPQAAAKKIAKEVTAEAARASKNAEAINDLLGKKVVDVAMYTHVRLPQVQIFARGKTTSSAVTRLVFNVSDAGTFTIATRPSTFLGSKFEVWADKEFGRKKLTAENVQAALRKHGYM